MVASGLWASLPLRTHLQGRGLIRQRTLTLIHRSAWKVNSASELPLNGVIGSWPEGVAPSLSGGRQEGGIGVARLKESSSSEARMIAECVLCTRLSCDAGHS